LSSRGVLCLGAPVIQGGSRGFCFYLAPAAAAAAAAAAAEQPSEQLKKKNA
jgi:hypothetical protein